MSTTADVAVGLLSRMLNEGYGSGAWHGPDLKSALGGVGAPLAFWRPGADRHNIAEIALHHAYCARNVRAQLSGREAAPFVVDGSDWFPVSAEGTLTWERIQDVVEAEQRQLAATVAAVEAGELQSPLGEPARVELVLGITCHAVYHAGQIQLIKRLSMEAH
jgi:DinB superfamily